MNNIGKLWTPYWDNTLPNQAPDNILQHYEFSTFQNEEFSVSTKETPAVSDKES